MKILRRNNFIRTLRYSGQERNSYSSEETKEYIYGLFERYLVLYIKRVIIYVL